MQKGAVSLLNFSQILMRNESRITVLNSFYKIWLKSERKKKQPGKPNVSGKEVYMHREHWLVADWRGYATVGEQMKEKKVIDFMNFKNIK